MSSVHITAEHLYFSYDKHVNILEDVSFSIRREEIVTIIGPNGGGKTTLLRLIMGLLQPDSGTIRIESPKSLARRTMIGYVPQHAGFDRHFPMTVSDVVLSGLIRPFGFFTKKEKHRAMEALEDVGLANLADNHISALSGGQTQRMLIARALVSEKEILLLDEPTSNIDPEAGKRLNSLLQALSRKLTIILVTHDTGFVASVTDRVFCINKSLVEHPMDDNFSNIVASSYGADSRIVRHDKALALNNVREQKQKGKGIYGE